MSSKARELPRTMEVHARDPGRESGRHEPRMTIPPQKHRGREQRQKVAEGGVVPQADEHRREKASASERRSNRAAGDPQRAAESLASLRAYRRRARVGGDEPGNRLVATRDEGAHEHLDTGGRPRDRRRRPSGPRGATRARRCSGHEPPDRAWRGSARSRERRVVASSARLRNRALKGVPYRRPRPARGMGLKRVPAARPAPPPPPPRPTRQRCSARARHLAAKGCPSVDELALPGYRAR